MKPKNFPERKNRRRREAQKRLYERMSHLWDIPLWMALEFETLTDRIMKSARDVRTKKDRRDRAKVAR